jgi:transaldolase
MKLFIDSANLDEIREAASWGIIDGVTTNPSLIAKEGRDFIETIHTICGLVDGPISAEVIAPTAAGMIAEGKALASLHKNVVVKVPLNIEGLKTCKALSSEGIGVNVTLCFQPAQALLAAKAGATYISPFVGRLDDICEDGVQLIKSIVDIYRQYPDLKTQVLAASIRHPLHIVQVAAVGSHVATLPFKVLKALYSHPLTDKGNAAFLKDWETVPNKDILGQVAAFQARQGSAA